jgi:transposase
MTSRTITMQKTREIIRLLESGLKEREVARAVNKSRTPVKNISSRIAASGLTHSKASLLSDDELKEYIYPTSQEEKESKADVLKKHLPEYLKKLNKKYENKLHLWELYLKEHPDGLQYSQFCHYLYQHAKKSDVCMALHHEYGDMLFVDFAGDPLFYTNQLTGEKIKADVFLAMLPASQYTYVECTPNQKMENWLSVNENALRYFGGVPKAIVPDCCKTAVTKAHKYESQKNPQYVQFAEHYNTVILPARPLHPRDKALVENAVNNVYRYIYPRILEREYYSLSELNEAVSILLKAYNERKMRAYDCSRIELYDSYERETMSELPVISFEYKQYQPPRSVSYGVYIYLKEDKHYYSIPHRYVKEKCDIYYNQRSVELFCSNKRVAIHRREAGINRFTTDEKHLLEKHRSYLKWSPEKLLSWAGSYGKNTKHVIDTILNKAKHPMEGVRSSLYVMSLSKRFPVSRVEKACKRALSFGTVNGKKIENILVKGLDAQEDEQLVFDDSLPDHDNIRHNSKEEGENDRTEQTENAKLEVFGHAQCL